MQDRAIWGKATHEKKVERFYATGLKEYHQYHGGYLSFGLWESGDEDYVDAAENLVRTLAQSIQIDENSHVLAVACGMAAECVYLHDAFGARIDAIDVTRKHIEIARQRVGMAGLRRCITLHHGSATELPFPADTFTHITGIEGQPHFDTREKFFHEAHLYTRRLMTYVFVRAEKQVDPSEAASSQQCGGRQFAGGGGSETPRPRSPCRAKP